MIEVVMKFGNSDQLPTAIQNGTLYFTMDTLCIYLDMNNERICLYENVKTRVTNLETTIGDIDAVLDAVNHGTAGGEQA